MNSSKKYMIIIGIFIILLASAFTVYYVVTGESNREWVPFESIDGQLAIVDRARTKWFKDDIDIMASDVGKRIPCEWLMFKSYGQEELKKSQEALEQFNADNMELVVNHNITANYWASITSWKEFLKIYNDPAAKDAFVEACKEATPELKSYIDKEINSFKQMAETEQMLDETGKLKPEAESRALLLHRYLWVQASQIQFPLNAIQPPEEVMAIFRWQIEESKMPFEAKLAKIQAFSEENPGIYDCNYAEAVVRIQNQDYEGACVLLKSLNNEAGMSDELQRKKYSRALAFIRKDHADVCPK